MHQIIQSRVSLLKIISLFAILVIAIGPADAQWRGRLDMEYRHFLNDSLIGTQSNNNRSLSLEPEYLRDWNNGRDLVSFRPYFRFDQYDNDLSQFDIRELLWTHADRSWELKAGVGKVFWGVTESQNLVDIVNQTDLVQDNSADQKLGQPMINLTVVKDSGNYDFYILPGFRERTFPVPSQRSRSQAFIDVDAAQYESPHAQRRIDTAFRWSQVFGNYDVGVSQFRGTQRQPRFAVDSVIDQKPRLTPIYDVVNQTGIDLQATFENILLKGEVVRQSGLRTNLPNVIEATSRWWATTIGFEFTTYDVAESGIDVGWLVEHLYDSRGEVVPFQNDIFYGTRIAMNDVHGSEVLFGIINDLNGRGRVVKFESSRRFGDHLRIFIEARSLSGVPEKDPLFSLRNDDYVQITLGYYY